MTKFFYIILISSFLCINIALADGFENFYSSFNDLLNGDLDPNTGLTSFPILMIPLGGRSEAMGTAFTAVADDVSFIGSNPSGSATLNKTELSFQHNNWIADTNIEGILYTARFNNLGIGIGGRFLYVPFTAYNAWGEESAKASYKEGLLIFNAAYRFFPSYYFYGVAIGTNIKMAYRNIPEIIYPNQSAFAAMIDIGALTRFNVLKFYSSREKNFSVGLAVKNIGPSVQDDALPTESSVGFAYSPLKPIILSTDINYPMNIASFSDSERINYATGISVVFTDFFSAMAGFRYRGNNPRFSLGSIIELSNMCFIVNYTLDLTTQVRSFDRFSIEAKLNLGDKGRKALQKKIDETYVHALEVYAAGDLNNAIILFEKVIELDPSFQPAKENLESVRKAMELQQKMKELQKVE